MRKNFKRIFLFMSGLILLVLSFGFLKFQKAKTNYSAQIESATKEEVTVHFDDFGIPHVSAKNAQDAYWTLGYITASERYFQADMMRRIGKGRLSEVFGEATLETDKLFRTLGISKHSESSLEMIDLNSEYLHLTKAYLKGFNQWVKEGHEPLEYSILGIEKEEFEMSDLMAISAYMAFNFNNSLKNDPAIHQFWSELGPEYMSVFKDSAWTLPEYQMNHENLSIQLESLESISNQMPFDPLMASNAWAVSPARSKSGKVLFSNDTHIRNNLPCTWFEANINYPGNSFYGNYLAGIPFALIGHSNKHAWGLTMLQNDDSDFFIENFNSEKNKYQHQGKWKNFEVRYDTIQVKDADPKVIEIRNSVHGPILNDFIELKDDTPIAFHWTYLKFENNLLEVFHKMNHSSSIENAEEAASMISAPGVNLIYGNSKGDIALWSCAKLIERDSTFSQVFLPGTGEYDIKGYLDFENNFKQINPPSGFVYSANEDHGIFNGIRNQGNYSSNYRANAIKTFLQEHPKLSIEELKTLVLEDIDRNDRKICNYLLNFLEREQWETEIKLLESWDGGYNIENKAPIIYQNWKYFLFKNIFQDEIGDEKFKSLIRKSEFKKRYQDVLFDFENLWWDNSQTDLTPEKIIQLSFEQAMDNLKEKLGSMGTAWEWGNCHQAEFVHPIGRQEPLDKLFNVGPIPCPGNSTTVNANSFTLNESCDYTVFSGPQMRIMIDFANEYQSESIIPVGQSGNPSSDHYKDQAINFQEGKWRKMEMKDEKFRSAKRKITFRPIK